MSVYRMPPGAVLLTGPALDACRYAVGVAQDARRRNGLPPSTKLAQLAEALTAAGHTDTAEDADVQPDAMTTAEAAAQLGCSERTARRMAPALGGRNIGGRWLVDRLAVAEHLEGTRP
ncbi:helix-turn-helix domain-containing protein [Tessaracoccus sp. Z1128]